MKDPREPTSEECTANAIVAEDDREIARACWYPQMGGYVGKCVVVFFKSEQTSDDKPPCFEAYVWHDGEFPFSDSGRSPAKLHHCSADQFRDFAETVELMTGS